MELAAVGVSIAVFNQVSRIAIFPLVSVTTSFVAEEDTIGILDSEPEVSNSVEMGSAVNGETKKLIPKGTLYFRPFFSLVFSLLVRYCQGLTSVDSNSFSNLNYIRLPLLLSGSGERPYDLEMHGSGHDTPKFESKRHIPSASAALVVGGILGLIQAIFLISGAKPILNFMGVHSVSSTLVMETRKTSSNLLFFVSFSP